MYKLSELNNAINALNDLWPLLEGDEKRDILRARDKLNIKASGLAHKMLLESTPEITAAIDQLNLVTQAAIDAKESIDDVSKRINKVAKTIEKASSAAVKVANLL
jgi:ABC-type transporter Mla subunit MlaD